MAAIDPVAYLRTIPPFDALPPALFDEAARTLEVSFHPAGTRLVRAGGTPLEHLYLIRKGAVRLERDGDELQVLEDGEIFGYTSLVTGEATFDVAVEEDLVAYRLPAAVFRHLLESAQFAGHFAVGIGQRLKSSLEHSPVATFHADLSVEVQQLVRRAPVWVDAGATVGDAAIVMRDEGISSVLVRGDGFFAIAEVNGVRLVDDGGASQTLRLDAAPQRPRWDAARRRLVLSTVSGSVRVLELPPRGAP